MKKEQAEKWFDKDVRQIFKNLNKGELHVNEAVTILERIVEDMKTGVIFD